MIHKAGPGASSCLKPPFSAYGENMTSQLAICIQVLAPLSGTRSSCTARTD